MKIAGKSCYEVKGLFVKKCTFYKDLKNIELPPAWSELKENYMEVSVDPNTQEYKEVERGFLTSDPKKGNKWQVTKLVRIQNLNHYKRYY